MDEAETRDTSTLSISVLASDEQAVIKLLEVAYETLNVSLFTHLLANDPDNNAEYLFFLSEPTPENETQWGFIEEFRIHKRMFNPENLDPGEPEVPLEFWMESIQITLTESTAFTERLDLYRSASNPGGLDSGKWKASGARYTTFVLFNTKGPNDFLVESEANFVVVEDLTKGSSDPLKFLLYRWEEIVPFPLGIEKSSWSQIKSIYRL